MIPKEIVIVKKYKDYYQRYLMHFKNDNNEILCLIFVYWFQKILIGNLKDYQVLKVKNKPRKFQIYIKTSRRLIEKEK